MFGCCPCDEDDTATATLTATPTATATFGTESGCVDCPLGFPEEWLMIVTGLENDEFDCCEAFNGEWRLKWGGGCFWRTDEESVNISTCNQPCLAGQPRWDMTPSRITARCFEFGSAGAALSYAIVGTFDCLGPNTYNLNVNSAGGCNGVPASVTVVPA